MTIALPSGLQEALAAALGASGWTQDPDLIAPHLVEWRERWRGQTPFLAMPASVTQVQALVRLCAEAGVAITPQGGNTGLVGGQIPQGEVLVSLKRLARIRAQAPGDDALVAEAGVTLQTVQEAALALGRRFPLSLASEGSATIGGLISTNAGGVHVRRHGMMRALVLGVEAVLPDGTLFEGLSSLRKDNTGYDLKQLFIGAEGTLGIVTAATLKLVPQPQEVQTALVQLASAEDAVTLLHRIEAETGALAVFEIINAQGMANIRALAHAPRSPFAHDAPWTALLEFEGRNGLAAVVEAALADALDTGLILDASLAASGAQRQAFWALRELQSAAQKPLGLSAKHDVSVPVSAVPAFLEAAGAALEAIVPNARVTAFGHVSDGNIHYDGAQPQGMAREAFAALIPVLQERVHDVALSFGGSISAEHGIGIARREEFLRREPTAALGLMRALKQAIDPQGIMNPRVLL
jgi:FAD/FMN-containing dehydrogenase